MTVISAEQRSLHNKKGPHLAPGKKNIYLKSYLSRTISKEAGPPPSKGGGGGGQLWNG